MTITLNNNIKVNLDNSKKLVRWDMLQRIQSEKTEILSKWFVAMNYFPRAVSTPVVDITDGIVYAKTSCGISADNKNYKSIVKYVRESVLENISYGIKNNCTPGLHNNSFGRNLMGHRFISVADASVEYLEAIYAQYMENLKKESNKKVTEKTKEEVDESMRNIHEKKVPESNVTAIYNLHYSKKGNEIIQSIIKTLDDTKKSINKIYGLQFGDKAEEFSDDINDVISYINHIWHIIKDLSNEEIIQIGGIRTTKKELFNSFEKAGISIETGMKALEAFNSLKK